MDPGRACPGLISEQHQRTDMKRENKKGQWGSSFGFLMATVGAAVGLGNLWGFPYKMGKGGGFIFLIIYLILVLLVGIVMTLQELATGRKSGKGVLYAYGAVDRRASIIGLFGWLSPLFIIGFYSMLGGYTIKYMIANLGDVFHAPWGVCGAESSEFFTAFYTNQYESAIYTVVFICLILFIIAMGIKNGIEKFSSVATPALFVMLLIVIARAVTLPGALEGVRFMLVPDWSLFTPRGIINVLASAGGQMFFSLSLGMGITVTYGSYVSKKDDLQQSAVLIPMADTAAALLAGFATIPAVFAEGLDPGQGPGMLFVTLQTVFKSMGAAGPVFGLIFYLLVFIAAITSAVSVMEAIVSTALDIVEARVKNANRVAVTIGCGIFALAEGLFVSLDGLGSHGFPQLFSQTTWLDTFDLLSEGTLMPIGALLAAILFGWIKPGYLDDEISLGSRKDSLRHYFNFCIRWIVPPIMIMVLLGQISAFFGLGWFD